jgi:type I restriction enzyme R subunit
MNDADISEAKTRKTFIDLALRNSGWGPIVRFQPGKRHDNCCVEEYLTATGPADYILFYKGKALACVEGKKIKIGPQNVLQQAKRYARGFPEGPFCYDDYHLPFVYSTNGKIIWFQDLRNPLNLSRELAAFHTPQALLAMLDKDEAAAAEWLEKNEISNQSLYPFQLEAIKAIEEAIIERKRHMLVAMATGTGKTYTIVNLIYRLMKSGFAKRIFIYKNIRFIRPQKAVELKRHNFQPGDIVITKLVCCPRYIFT